MVTETPQISTRKKLMTLNEVADQCQVSVKTIRRWIKHGDLHALRLGLQWRVDPDDLDLFLWKNRR